MIAAGKTESVDLFIATGACQDEETYKANVCHISMNASSAKEKLCGIYKNAFVTLNKKVLPIDLLCTKLENIEELKAKLEEKHGGPWTYFAGKDLFINELEKYSGYPATNFEKKWEKACKDQKELLDSLVSKIEGVVKK